MVRAAAELSGAGPCPELPLRVLKARQAERKRSDRLHAARGVTGSHCSQHVNVEAKRTEVSVYLVVVPRNPKPRDSAAVGRGGSPAPRAAAPA